jgi:hypothetical protein
MRWPWWWGPAAFDLQEPIAVGRMRSVLPKQRAAESFIARPRMGAAERRVWTRQTRFAQARGTAS